jgi:Tol biopolymer transport system component/DNA-binding winged helix-turn-helix (wHTH) protein
MAAQTRLIYQFDEFQLEPNERRLRRGGEIVPLQGKAFEMLLVLIRNRGNLLTKDELFELVWPDQIVEESNLTVNMSAIRRALGERASHPRYITTVSGQGYRFTGDVRQFAADSLTIERESFARVVVEQEELESTIPFGVSASQIGSAVRRLISHRFLPGVLGTIVLAVAVGGFWLEWTRRATSAPLPWTKVTMRRFAAHGGVPFRAAISPDGKSLVYAQRLNGKFSLWLGQIETNSSVLILDQPDVGYNGVAISPDGQTIYLSEFDPASAGRKLVCVPVVGGVPSELTTHVDSVVTFSPDGRQLAFMRRERGQTSIIVADADGKNERQVTSRKRPENFSGNGISWSPDGKYIAVAGSGADNKRVELLAISLADGSTRKIGNRDWGFIGNLTWQSDGRGLLLIVFNSSIARRSEIWFVPYPEGEPRKVTNDLNQYYSEALSLSSNNLLAVLNAQIESEIWLAPEGDASRARLVLQGVAPTYEGIDGLAWTPDGHLLYSAYVGDAQAIWEMDSDGNNRRRLTANTADFVDRQMSVTADNRFIVFQSNRSGSFEIWRANRDGSGLKQLTSGANNSQPAVSPDGKWILYVSDRQGMSTLWRVSVDGEDPVQITHNNSVQGQISPDGKRIAYLENEDSTLRLVIIPFAGGQPERTFLLRPTANLNRRMRWAPDGKAIIYRQNQDLWRQRLDQDKPELIKGFEDVQIYQLAWSLDGKTLAYTRGAQMQEIMLLQNAK